MKDSLFSRTFSLNIRGNLFDLNTPKVMGVLNITPDSFYEGSRVTSTSTILQKAENMLNNGADILDIGGFSTRPGAKEVSFDEELERVIPATEAIIKAFPSAIISIDTFRSGVAEKAIAAGASIINDISGGQADELMFETVARLKVPYILMHMRGTPTTMMKDTNYENVTKEVLQFFARQTNKLKEMGHSDIILDPGFGFSKTLEQNYELLRHLNDLLIVGYPVLIGVSRKSMIHKLLKTTPEMALNGTNILNFAALEKGARILRVHDVREAQETIKLFSVLQG